MITLLNMNYRRITSLLKNQHHIQNYTCYERRTRSVYGKVAGERVSDSALESVSSPNCSSGHTRVFTIDLTQSTTD